MEENRLFQAIFNQAAVGMAQVDLQGRWIRVNQKLCDIVGYTREEMQAMTFQAITYPEDLAEDLEGRRRLAAGEIPLYHREKRYVHRQGHPIWVSITVSVERHPVTGAPEWFIAVTEEITGRKAAEQSLREKEAFLQGIYEGVEEAIFVVDVGPGDDFTFADFNPAYMRLAGGYGVDIRELRGMTTRGLIRFFPPEAVEVVRAGYTRCATSGKPLDYEESVVLENKLTHWHTRLTPIPDPQGKVFRIIGTSRNISQQKEDAERILKTEENLRQAQKMEAIGRLAGGIAHDFNNLLTAINGYGELLLALPGMNGTEADFIREIRNAGERAASLTRQLLAFSRKQVLAPKAVDLNGVVSDMGNLLKRLIGEDVTLETALAEGLGPILADRGQIEQVIMNLAINARDAMTTGGRLGIATARADLGRNEPLPDASLPPGLYARLTVSDTGKGMDAATRSRIFEPFFTTKPAGVGTGLGLSMVYGIVKQSGGHIQAASQEGSGTTFEVFLPLAGPEAGPEPAPQAAGAPLTGSETILVVEDEQSLARLIGKILTAGGYQVLAAGSGQEAMSLADAHPGDIHLLLTDVVMAQVGGRVLAEYLQARRPNLRLIYMSGYTDDTVVRHGVHESRAEFLQKPFTPEGLMRRIRRVLDA